ncbi:hypothetical protein [Staphylococcus equorum]|uniref:HK97 gp10 family phage protein n=1 Tax=Staphylococcus equorum TaxID=246432 RepID=A0A9X4R586_9STAP|nr:hypothetical protein [Staphylococcus equorum]MDG0860323.1 hypothetical protein [Staphylococcus equorum]
MNVKGLNQLMTQLESKLGKRKMDRIIDKALVEGGKVIVKRLQENFEPWADTHASQLEITMTGPQTLNGKRTVTIHWKGQKDRWKIIHMNEYGTIKNPNPSGKGAIDRSIRQGQERYFEVVKYLIERALR